MPVEHFCFATTVHLLAALDTLTGLLVLGIAARVIREFVTLPSTAKYKSTVNYLGETATAEASTDTRTLMRAYPLSWKWLACMAIMLLGAKSCCGYHLPFLSVL